MSSKVSYNKGTGWTVVIEQGNPFHRGRGEEGGQFTSKEEAGIDAPGFNRAARAAFARTRGVTQPKETTPKAAPESVRMAASELPTAEELRERGDWEEFAPDTLNRTYMVTIDEKRYFVKLYSGRSTAGTAIKQDVVGREIAHMMGLTNVPLARVGIDPNTGGNLLVSEWIDGDFTTVGVRAAAMQLPPEELAKFTAFEFVAGNRDGHLGNYMALDNGSVIPTDLELYFDGNSYDRATFDRNEIFSPKTGQSVDSNLLNKAIANRADVVQRLKAGRVSARRVEQRYDILAELTASQDTVSFDDLRIASADHYGHDEDMEIIW